MPGMQDESISAETAGTSFVLRPFRFRLSAFGHGTSSLFRSWVQAHKQDLGPVPGTQVRGCGVSGFQRLALETLDSFRAQAR